MADTKRNLTVGINSEIRDIFLKFCENAGFPKGDVAEKLIASFLAGKSLTTQELIESERERLKIVAQNQISGGE